MHALTTDGANHGQAGGGDRLPTASLDRLESRLWQNSLNSIRYIDFGVTRALAHALR